MTDQVQLARGQREGGIHVPVRDSRCFVFFTPPLAAVVSAAFLFFWAGFWVGVALAGGVATTGTWG